MGTAVDGVSAELPPRRPMGPHHEAIAYCSPGQLVARIASQVGAAVVAGDVVTAVLADDAGEELRAALGSEAGSVDFQDPREVHRVPGFTTAVRWARTSKRIVAPDRRGLIVGQQLTDLPGCDDTYWRRLCIGLDVALAGLPLTVLCPYLDEAPHQDRARQTHRLLDAAGQEPNAAYRSPEEAVLDYPQPPPPDLGTPVSELHFRAPDLGGLRHLVAGIAAAGGLGPDRVADAVLAVNELASNSVEHGPGSGRLRLWTGDGLVAEVADAGRMSQPFPGMVLPPPAGARGRGLWLASELSDVLQVWTGDGTVIRLSWRV